MRCLVVLAHPLHDSLCRTLAESAVSVLSADGHSVTLEDLCQSGFSAALTSAERRSYYCERYDFAEVSAETDRLLAAEALVLVFPTWWYGFPAILKGWFDRVWAPGIAYNHASDLGPIKPLLSGLRHTLAITTLGSSWWIDACIMRRPLRRVLKRAILGACAPSSAFEMLSLYKAERLSRADVNRFCLKIEKSLSQWRGK